MPQKNIPSEPAAAYVRMSTDHQDYSTDNQMEAIRKYAERFNLKIEIKFSDEGKSGVTIDKRNGIKNMLELIKSGKARFKHILVYDISRWGRFHDPDEAAYYEFECKKAGIKVHYCAEMFKNDGSLAADLSKIVKRKMAHEMVRELSVKVLQGQCNLIRRGYKQGGFAGYGLRRALIDEKGNFKCILRHGERKSIQSDRVVLTPGPPDEIRNVRRIYSMFIDNGKKEGEIASTLNSEGILSDLGRKWTIASIRQILTNEKYIGNYLFNKVSQRIEIQNPYSPKRITRKNPPEDWVRYEGGFKAVVEKERFMRVREIMAERAKKFSNEYLLEKLRQLYGKHKMISGVLINETVDMPSSAVYAHRFGSLIRAYHAVGYTPDRDYSYIELNRLVREMHSEIIDSILAQARRKGLDFNGFDRIMINGEISLSVIISRCRASPNGLASWILKFERRNLPDFTIAVRLNPDNVTVKDYYVISKYDMDLFDKKLGEKNGLLMDTFRYDDIEWFYTLFERKELQKEFI